MRKMSNKFKLKDMKVPKEYKQIKEIASGTFGIVVECIDTTKKVKSKDKDGNKIEEPYRVAIKKLKMPVSKLNYYY